MKSSIFADIKARLSVPDVLRMHGAEPPQGDGLVSCPLPGHTDGKPSFSVFDGGRKWRCHGPCDAGGDVVDLEQAITGADRTEAVRSLAGAAGINPDRDGGRGGAGKPGATGPPVDPEEALRAWCSGRCLDRERFRSSRPVLSGGRPALRFATPCGTDRLRFLDDSAPKTRWVTKGTGRPCWYGLSAAHLSMHGDLSALYVVNGEPSVWACAQSGVPAVCTCSGEGAAGVGREPWTSMARDLAEGIGDGRPVRVVYDLDEVGRKGAAAVVRMLRVAGLRDVEALALPANLGEHGDVDDLHRRVGDGGLAAALAALAVVEVGEEAVRVVDRPAITVCGDLHLRTESVLGWIVANNDPPWLWQRGGDLVTLGVRDERAALIRIDVDGLRRIVGQRAQITVPSDDPEKGPIRKDVPADVCASIIASPQWPLPVVRGIVRCPGLAPDGSLLSIGYSPSARVVVDWGEERFGAVPARPTDEDVRTATALLDEAICDFPFADESSRTNALAMMLTPFVVPLLPDIGGRSPMFLVSAPSPGSGKSLLTDIAGVMATGTAPEDLSISPRDDAETQKRILAALVDSPAVLRIDNLPEKKTIDAPSIASALTLDVYRGRVLGKTESLGVPNRAVWLATGNNPVLSPELSDRCCTIRFRADCERPRDRTGFRHELPEWPRKERGRLVAAALTLVRRWVVDGQRPGGLRLGSFQAWASALSGILEVADVAGLMANRHDSLDTQDDDTQTWRSVVATWHDRFGRDPVVVADLLEMLSPAVRSGGSWHDPEDRPAESSDLADAVLGDAQTPAQRRKRLSDALRVRAGRVYGDHRIVRGGHSGKLRSWTWLLEQAGIDSRSVDRVANLTQRLTLHPETRQNIDSASVRSVDHVDPVTNASAQAPARSRTGALTCAQRGNPHDPHSSHSPDEENSGLEDGVWMECEKSTPADTHWDAAAEETDPADSEVF